MLDVGGGELEVWAGEVRCRSCRQAGAAWVCVCTRRCPWAIGGLVGRKSEGMSQWSANPGTNLVPAGWTPGAPFRI